MRSGAGSRVVDYDICSGMQGSERSLPPTINRTLSTMPALKSYLWWAMSPTAFLSLASLLTYLVFRIVYLATAGQYQQEHSQDGVINNRLRTVALPWIFFGLEIIILREYPLHSRSIHVDFSEALTLSSLYSTERNPIPAPDHCHQTSSPRETILGRR